MNKSITLYRHPGANRDLFDMSFFAGMADWKLVMLAAKISAFLVVLGLSVFILVLSSQKALAASLKDVAIISGDVIKLGDVFDGLKQNADYVLGPAPQPGTDMVLNARTLYRIAVAMDLPWRPVTSAEQVTVRRAATIIPEAAVQSALRDALMQEGLQDDFNINVSGTKDIVLPENLPQTIEVSALRFDPQKDFFEATLAAPSASNPIKKISVMGQVERLTRVPVLKSGLRNGDIIGATDIEWIDMVATSVQRDTITREDSLTGMTPQNIVHAGKPIKTTDLERPQIVARGENVILIFAEGPLVLSTKGKALQNGAIGDLVRVTNLNSSKTVDGYVTGSQEITVR
jgi:flagella basal body P-ring formation protein FlgA